MHSFASAIIPTIFQSIFYVCDRLFRVHGVLGKFFARIPQISPSQPPGLLRDTVVDSNVKRLLKTMQNFARALLADLHFYLFTGQLNSLSSPLSVVSVCSGLEQQLVQKHCMTFRYSEMKICTSKQTADISVLYGNGCFQKNTIFKGL